MDKRQFWYKGAPKRFVEIVHSIEAIERKYLLHF